MILISIVLNSTNIFTRKFTLYTHERASERARLYNTYMYIPFWYPISVGCDAGDATHQNPTLQRIGWLFHFRELLLPIFPYACEWILGIFFHEI